MRPMQDRTRALALRGGSQLPRIGAAIASSIIALTAFLVPSAADASAQLANAKNCGACHAMDRKRIGPSYQAIAEKYAADREAVPKLTRKILEGGVGVWGQVPMPAMDGQVSQDEATRLVQWILSTRK
jgi:cytochrome c